MSWMTRAGLTAAISAAVLLLSPPAGADPGGASSCNHGGKTAAIDDAARHHPLTPNGDLAQYCDVLLKNALATGKIVSVDSPSDFIAGCQDEGRAILASQ